MKRFEELTIKQVKKEILYFEQDNENPKSVIVICIGQSPDSEPYLQGDGTTCEHFFANVLIDGEPCSMGYEWNCDDEEITSSWNRDEENDDDESN